MTNSADKLSFDSLCPQDWFDKALEENPDLKQLVTVLGKPFAAMVLISGVRITALLVNTDDASATEVEFGVTESGGSRLPVGEFRRRLTAALINDQNQESYIEKLDAQNVQSVMGASNILLAPVVGIMLKEAVLQGNSFTIIAEMSERQTELSVTTFLQEIRSRVQGALASLEAGPVFRIDPEQVVAAEAAGDEGRWEQVVSILGHWPTPLASLFRTQQGQSLTLEVRDIITRGLFALGQAFIHTGKSDWAEEVMRLGIQWSMGDALAGKFFLRLGEVYASAGRDGEAIGMLRRALALKENESRTLMLLSKCFAATDRQLAALACADEAIRSGASLNSLQSVYDKASAKLGSPLELLRQWTPNDEDTA